MNYQINVTVKQLGTMSLPLDLRPRSLVCEWSSRIERVSFYAIKLTDQLVLLYIRSMEDILQ